MKKITVMMGLLFLIPAIDHLWANGNEVANGGTARVCEGKQDGTKALELYDYWEGKIIMPSYHVDLGAGSFDQKILHVLDRIARFDPYRAERLRKKANVIFSHLDEYLTDAKLYKTNDGNYTYNPAYEDDKIKCYEVQFAVRLKKLRGEQKRFTIVRDAWNMGDGETREVSRAGMILHEINGEDSILRENDEFRDNTRYFTFVISSDAIGRFTAEDYLKLLKDSNRISNNNTILIEGKHYFPDELKVTGNQVTHGITISDDYAKLINLDFNEGRQLMEGLTLTLENISIDIPQWTWVSVVDAYNNEDEWHRPNIELRDHFEHMVIHTKDRTLNNVGLLAITPQSRFKVTESSLLTDIQVQNQWVKPLWFHANGKVRQLELKAPQDTQNGYQFTTETGEVLKFDDFRWDLVLHFNAEEMLVSYDAASGYDREFGPNQHRKNLRSLSDQLWKDPNMTDRLYRLQIGATGVENRNGDRSRNEALPTGSLEFLPADFYDSSYLGASWYREGEGRDATNRALLLQLNRLPWKSPDEKLQFGYRGTLIRYEEDRFRDFESTDVLSAGLAFRLYPLHSSTLRFDLGAEAVVGSEAHIANPDAMRVSSEWRAHAAGLRGASLNEDQVKDVMARVRKTDAYLARLNVCYRTPDKKWECNAGGFYRMEQLNGSPDDRLSPHRGAMNRDTRRWNAYFDLKLYMDRSNSGGDAFDGDPNNYFFVRAEMDDSNLGSELQDMFNPDKSMDQLDKRTSLNIGYGWEW